MKKMKDKESYFSENQLLILVFFVNIFCLRKQIKKRSINTAENKYIFASSFLLFSYDLLLESRVNSFVYWLITNQC